MTTFLHILIAFGFGMSAVLAFKLFQANKSFKAAEARWKVAYDQRRQQIDQMRLQLSGQALSIQGMSDELNHLKRRLQLTATLEQGDAQRAATDKVLTSSGFAETIPADEWRATEPFPETRLHPIPGIIDGRRRTI